jgi:hypothetical protein
VNRVDVYTDIDAYTVDVCTAVVAETPRKSL